MNQAPAQSGQPPRLAFVSGLSGGGAATFLCNLAGELVRRNVPVIVVSPEKENAFASDFQRAGIKVFLHDQRRMIFEDRLPAMLQIIAGFRPTAVIGCMGEISYEVLRYVPPGVRRVGIVQTDAGFHYEGAAPYGGHMDVVVGVSRKITERFATMGGFQNVSKLCLLHGVTVPPTATPRGKHGQPLRILYLGRIIDGQKRAYLFPKILANLQSAGIPFHWTLAGEGEQRTKIEPLMQTNRPDQRVVFSGLVPNAQVPALMEQHDIFLLASEAEGLPISLLEAMAHGVVPVVSDLESGIRDVVDDSNGIRVSVEDVEGYARAIIRLHEHRDELAAKSIAAHARVKKEYSVQAMADRWLAALPVQTPNSVTWPARWNIQPPLRARHPLYFSPPMRVLRRLAAKYRQ